MGVVLVVVFRSRAGVAERDLGARRRSSGAGDGDWLGSVGPAGWGLLRSYFLGSSSAVTSLYLAMQHIPSESAKYKIARVTT